MASRDSLQLAGRNEPKLADGNLKLADREDLKAAGIGELRLARRAELKLTSEGNSELAGRTNLKLVSGEAPEWPAAA